MRRNFGLVGLVSLGSVATLAACIGDEPTAPLGDASAPPGDASILDTGASGDASGDTSTPTPDGGGDAPACASPTQACDKACVDVSKDPLNCGRCTHDCAGGECKGGVCQIVTLTQNTNAPTNRNPLATDGTSVCWTVTATTGFVYCVPATSATPVTPRQVWAGKKPGPIAFLGGDVIWTAQGALASANLRFMKGQPNVTDSGTMVREWIPDGTTVSSYSGYQLTVIGTRPYLGWSESFGSNTTMNIVQCNVADCSSYTSIHSTTSTDALSARPKGFATDNTALYVAYGGSPNGQVVRVQTGGGATPLASTEIDPINVAVDKGFVYWDVNSFAIRRSQSSVASAVDITTSMSNVGGLVVHDDVVYWTELGRPDIYTAPAVGGGVPSVYGVSSPTDEPGYLAHDAKALYWVDRSNGSVKKLAFK